jgi:SPP1 family predicted phage head-tail adaptor
MAEVMGRRCKTTKPIKINSSQLNRRIVFEKLTQTQDTEGGMVDSWATDFTMSASVRNWPPRSSVDEVKLTRVGGDAAIAKTEFTVRYAARITNLHRILYDSKIYNINHINDFNGLHEYMVVTCDTGHNDGR